MSTILVGDKVRVSRSHWARARETGTIAELTDDGRFIVKFDRQGIGFDDGWCLQLRQEDLDER